MLSRRKFLGFASYSAIWGIDHAFHVHRYADISHLKRQPCSLHHTLEAPRNFNRLLIFNILSFDSSADFPLLIGLSWTLRVFWIKIKWFSVLINLFAILGTR